MTTGFTNDAGAADLQPQGASPGPDPSKPTGEVAAAPPDHGSAPAAPPARVPVAQSLADLPTACEYMRRIGAQVRGFWTAAVSEREGRYSRERATVRLTNDGTKAQPVWRLTVRAAEGEDAAEFEPNEIELQAILFEAAHAHWPKPNKVHSARNLPDALNEAYRTDSVFEFRDADGLIVMLQQRVEKDGDKAYVPWTYFDDNQWRPLEPEVLLPLWGIDQLKTHGIVFLHEGAKAARAVRRMVEAGTPEAKRALAAHPWGVELQNAAHLGWIGGALAPHRTDWEVIARAGVTEVFIVADNDEPGHAAVPKIARALRQYPIRVRAVRFDKRWPSGFDLADPFPDRLYEGEGEARRYAGPTMADCTEQATWLTSLGPVPPVTGRGRPPRPPVYLRPEGARGYAMRVGATGPTFYDYDNPKRPYNAVGFDKLTAPFSDGDRTSDLFARQAFNSRVDELTYAPGELARILTVDSDRSLNMHRPALLPALSFKPTVADWQPFEDYLKHLIPSADERGHVKRYLATMWARPGVRMLYALLLASPMQGVGKTTLGLIAKKQVGAHNTSEPTAHQVINSAFNSWVALMRLVIVNEIYAEGNWKAYDQLKTYITDPFIRVNTKNIAEYTVPNWANFMLFSNAEVPLQVHEQDRRLLVPTVTNERYPACRPNFWREFHAWLAGDGHSLIRAWAEDFVTKHGAVRAGDAAPATARKDQMIEDSRSPNERLARDLAAAALARGTRVVLVDHEVIALMARQTGNIVKPARLHGWLAAAGMHVSADRMTAAGRAGKVAATFVIGDETWPDLKEYHLPPHELEGL